MEVAGMTRTLAAAFVMAAVLSASLAVTGRAVDEAALTDRVFARWTAATPGCAVGVATKGQPVLAKGYGKADLEHNVPIGADTIFEAGSVSKQFTAASVLLLARGGKLSLDDPVRQHVPELPDYGSPLTIRHMLTHTSGLRDWGSVEGIAGWPRTTRVYTHAHVLEIVSHQRALNFTPGTRWSYSNTGFNLAAIIVSRVSGMPFADFTRERLFKPLGMTHTSWRDDYTRIVQGRAQAYAERGGTYHTDMPFENVYGNGGLLTTVGDLLKWNEHFDSPAPGDTVLVAQQQQREAFSDGRPHGYALGLFLGTHKGLREVFHSGSTAGYSAFLTRFPDERVSVAVLCNAADANAAEMAHDVADIYLGNRVRTPAAPTPTHVLTAAEIDAVAGLYREAETGVPMNIALDQNELKAHRVGVLVPQSGSHFATALGQTWEFDGRGRARVHADFTTDLTYERVAPAKPSASDLASYAGVYTSDEAETVLTAVVEGGTLLLMRSPDTKIELTPAYADAFNAGSLGVVIFRRDGAGRIVELSVSQDRVWDLRFRRGLEKAESRKPKAES
jgi:CubicO group peptidase (beta-lactamase class C family)